MTKLILLALACGCGIQSDPSRALETLTARGFTRVDELKPGTQSHCPYQEGLWRSCTQFTATAPWKSSVHGVVACEASAACDVLVVVEFVPASN